MYELFSKRARGNIRAIADRKDLGEGVSPKLKQLSPKFENAEERKKLRCDFLSSKKYLGENRERR